MCQCVLWYIRFGCRRSMCQDMVRWYRTSIAEDVVLTSKTKFGNKPHVTKSVTLCPGPTYTRDCEPYAQVPLKLGLFFQCYYCTRARCSTHPMSNPNTDVCFPWAVYCVLYAHIVRVYCRLCLSSQTRRAG